MSSDLETLLEMGWTTEYAEKALSETNHQGLQEALEWIIDHPQEEHSDSQSEPAIIEDPKEQTPLAIPPSEPKSYKCEDCGKNLRTSNDIQMHSARTGHANFTESTDEVKPLTEEEKAAQMARVQEHLRMKKLQREKQEKEQQLEDEKRRRSQGKNLLSAKAKFQEDEMKRNAEQQKREKEEDRKYREQLLAVMAKEKEEKLAKANAAKMGNVDPAAAAISTISPVLKSSPTQVATTCQLNIRTPTGVNLRQTFKPDEKLSAVINYLRKNWPRQANDIPVIDTCEIYLQTGLPVHKFDVSEMSKSLLDLGLCPSAVLIARLQ